MSVAFSRATRSIGSSPACRATVTTPPDFGLKNRATSSVPSSCNVDDEVLDRSPVAVRGNTGRSQPRLADLAPILFREGRGDEERHASASGCATCFPR